MPAKIMVDYNPIIKTVLSASAPLVALVSTRITDQFPSSAPIFPLATYAVLDSFHIDSDYFDNDAQSENVLIEIQSWHQAGASPMPTAIAIDTALAADGWNRQYSQGFVEQSTKYRYNVARYTKRFR